MITFGMNVGNFLELKCTLQSNGIHWATTNEKRMFVLIIEFCAIDVLSDVIDDIDDENHSVAIVALQQLITKLRNR